MRPDTQHENARRRNIQTAAVAIATVGLFLSGCTHGSGSGAPTVPHNPNAVSDVRTILAAITQDPCSTPDTADRTNCEGRYIAQVIQVANTARASAAQFPDPADVRKTARKLIAASDAFQKLSCDSTPDRTCHTTLNAVDDDLRNLSRALDTTASPTS